MAGGQPKKPRKAAKKPVKMATPKVRAVSGHISNARFERALRDAQGVYAYAAQILGCSRQNVEQRTKRSEKFLAVIRDFDETVTDAAVVNVRKAIVTDKDLQTSRWWLAYKGAARGFRSAGSLGSFEAIQTITAPTDGKPIESKVTIRFINPDGETDDIGGGPQAGA